jgi:Notch-like protein
VKRALLLVFLALAAACNVNPYNLAGNDGDGGRDGGGSGGDGGGGDDGGGIDAPTDAPVDASCVPTPEVCDTVDNDCDTMADEGFNTQADPNNCGQCGMRCQYPNAFGVCTNGGCSEGACQPGWNDTMPGTPGCDYFCIRTNNGVEVCDNRDNDCDTEMDEDFNLATDVNNCGSCGNVCNLLHASEACVNSMCEVVTCDAGFYDIDPGVAGCEYQCTLTNGGVESCDGRDNDCDGMVDDGNPGGGASCGTDEGVCTAGTTQCSNGVLFCVGQTTGGPEICDNEDDDCNGVIDDGFDKMNDPQHCGGCTACNLPFSIEGCSMGVCTVATCDFGHYDEDGNPANGCEYQCIPTGVESCDSADNDCDGNIDEGINTTTDPNNCGMCGRVCSFANAGATCSNSTCAIGTCNPNFYDLDSNPANGCEYGCILSNGGVEACDSLDNDCDGTVNDGNPGGGVSCGVNTGECSTGTTVCTGGQIQCPDDIEPVAETCNNLDDDCNNVIDNGFNKLTDVRYCNNCAGCNLDHAVAGCSGGMCTVAGCLAGWVDLDGMPGNGCEYNCTASGLEVCDGRDNVCDGLVDQADPSILVPGNFCDPQGECAGTTPTCAGMAGWDCVYTDPDVELQANGDPVAEETRCDGKDNDCDGGADEVYPLKNTACAEDGTFSTTRKLGICRGTGSLICNAAQNGLRCNVTTAGLAAANETCNNRDDDCDGKLDEPYDNPANVPNNGLTGVRDTLIGPVTINAIPTMMYQYESSRPDATASNAGFVETRACSTTTKMPWAGSDYNEARNACLAAGMRLCRVTRSGGVVTSDEWGRFCEGASNRTFPYGNTFVANNCNGSEYDPVAGGVNEDQAVATGALATCVSQDSSRDQSGNLKEWVDDPRVVSGQTVHTLRGGSFDNFEHGMTCDFDLTVVPQTYTFANTGFRCCSRQCTAGQTDCNGSCVNLASSATNCGACGVTCGGGTTCSNGYCCPTGTRACGDVCVATATACP